MQFGSWIRDVRKRQSLNLATLADAIDLNTSSLSRIEKGTLSPTVKVAIQLADILQVDRGEFYRAASGNPHFSLPMPPQHPENILTFSDVVQFEDFFQRNPPETRQTLCEWLNEIDQHSRRSDTGLPAGALFQPENIDLLMTDSHAFTLELRYPANLQTDKIEALYHQGGVLLPEDVYIYLYANLVKSREEYSKSETVFPLSMLNQLRRSGNAQRIRLSDLIRFDELLAANGHIPVMCLKAVEYQNMFIPKFLPEVIFVDRISDWRNVKNYPYGYLLLFIHRWFYHLDIVGDSWVASVREKIQPSS